MCVDDGDHVRLEISASDLAKLLGVIKWNTVWTCLGAVAGWVALAIVVRAVV